MQVTQFIALRTAAVFVLMLCPFVVICSKNSQDAVTVSSLLAILLPSESHPKKDYARTTSGPPRVLSLDTAPVDTIPGPPRGLSTVVNTSDRGKKP